MAQVKSKLYEELEALEREYQSEKEVITDYQYLTRSIWIQKNSLQD